MDQDIQALNQRIVRLERSRRHLFSVLALGLLASLVVAFDDAGNGVADLPDVLRVRGLVIEDDNGVDRVVLGAPSVPGKKRAGKGVDLTVYGMVVKDDQGRPRIAISSPEPDPRLDGKVYARRMKTHGITFHDEEGNERGGLGYGDDGSVVYMTDHKTRDGAGAVVWPNGAAEVRAAGKSGLPAVSLAVRPDGFVGLYVVGPGGQMMGELALVENGQMKLKLTDAEGNELFKSQ